jgi:ligand-binding sensor domain-containing protein
VWTFILWEGVYRFDGTSWQKVGKINGGIVTDITVAVGDTPWIAIGGGWHGPGGGLAHWDGSAWIEVASENRLEPITSVALGPEGVIAAGTNLGLGIRQGGKWRLLKDGPTYAKATSVAVTPDGAAWFAFGDYTASARYPGLSRFNGQSWQYFLDDVEVTTLAVAPDGSLWAGVGCSIRRFDGVTWETVAQCEQDLPVGNIFDIAFTPDGTAWVANGFSLARFDGQSWTVYEKLANSIVTAPDGAVWINGWKGLQGSFYVARFDGENWMTFPSADAFPGGFQVAAATADGCVWGITDGGLTCFDGESWTDSLSWTFYPIPDTLSLESARTLVTAPDGSLWMRADNGLARFDVEGASDEKWTIYICEHGCGSAIAFAPDGAVWIGTTHFRPTHVEDMQ